MLGAIIGDVVGSVYEFNNIFTKEFNLFGEYNRLTDDSIMTIAVAEILKNNQQDDKEAIIDNLKKWGMRYRDAGYGDRFYVWLKYPERRDPYYSCGNGSAMRISPVGWYANTEEEVRRYSRAITEVTHNHPEGIKGAEVVSMCIYYARIGKTKKFIKKYIESQYDIDYDYEELKQNFRYANITCQETVPPALYCFLISKDFEDCLRTTISIGGDCDTTSAISCAIAEAFYGVPENIKSKINTYLTEEMKQILEE